MPDGFDAKKELERIYTLRELMTECRRRVPQILQEVDRILESEDSTDTSKIAVMDMMLSRGFGKPRQHHIVTYDSGDTTSDDGVKIYIPHNHRDNLARPPLVIDQSGIEQVSDVVHRESNE